MDTKEIFGVALAAAAAAAGVVRWLFVRHREYVLFREHMQEEQSEVWPAIRRELSDVKGILGEHGERLARVEAKMPDGQIQRIEEMVRRLVDRKG